MSFADLPAGAAWRHRDSRAGFEVAFFAGSRIRGGTAAVEDDVGWLVRYDLVVDEQWRTRSARIESHSARGVVTRVLETHGDGRWLVDGVAAPHLEGCLDVDLESSAMTNTLPIHRLALPSGARSDAPAAYVRAVDLRVELLEQTYERITGRRYHYTAPIFDFTAELEYDAAGLVIDYPGIAVRVH